METLLITVKDPDKKDFLLALLAELDFVQVKEAPERIDFVENGTKDDSIVGYDVEGKPLSSVQFERETKEDLEAARKGGTIPLEDYVKDTTEWLKGTK